MYLNQFSVRVPEGRERSGYVELPHGTKFSLVLRNNRTVRCDARVEINGEYVGTWRIAAKSSFRTDRAVHDDGQFTFYKADTHDGQRVGIRGDPNNGLITVVFIPEKERVQWLGTPDPETVYRGGSTPQHLGIPAASMGGSASMSPPKGVSEGIVGLSGHSDLHFHRAENIDYDLSQKTTIHLRLVCDDSGPRPLTSVATPVPPPVW
jgi:hypothetical protein